MGWPLAQHEISRQPTLDDQAERFIERKWLGALLLVNAPLFWGNLSVKLFNNIEA